jgi:hypothetical protein
MFRKIRFQMQQIKPGKIKYPGVAACLLLSIFLYSCTNENKQTAEQIIKTSLEAVGTKADREKMQNLESLADCMSPNGKYTTKIHTASGGYSYFKQVYSYKPKPFEAVIENKASGYVLGDSIKLLPKEAVYTIRSHEFHNMVFEVDQRFHDFVKPERVDTGGVNAYRLKAKDELNNECLLFFDVKTGLLSALHFQNPTDAKEIIPVKFSNWKKQQGLLLPLHIDIKQADKSYSFDFKKLLFNSKEFKMISATGTIK